MGLKNDAAFNPFRVGSDKGNWENFSTVELSSYNSENMHQYKEYNLYQKKKNEAHLF